MHLIFCVDEQCGLSFCGRRLSRDQEVSEHILQLSNGHPLWMSPNSASLFPKATGIVDPDFLKKASIGDYCFAEAPITVDSVHGLESVILYRWNRRYPSTEKLCREILTGMHLSHTEEFPGKSHEKITMERYTL